MQGQPPIKVDAASGCPSPSPSLKSDMHRVVFARHIQHRKVYELRIPSAATKSREAAERLGCTSFDVNIRAELAASMHYEGDGLKEAQPVVDVSLHVDMSPLRQYLREQRESESHSAETPLPVATCVEPAGTATREAIDAWQQLYIRHLLDVSERMNAGGHVLEKYVDK